MPDNEEDKSKEISAKNAANREAAMDKSRELSKGIFRSAETLNANAERRRVRDDRAFTPVTSWKQIPGAISARAMRNAEIRLLQPFGMAGEAIFQARRANVGQKLTAAKNVVKLNILSRIGGGGVIGEYFANKIGNSVDFSEDPTKLAASFKITAEAISHELVSVNNRFKANENSINSIQESVKKLESSVNDTLKGMQQHLDPIRKVADEALQKSNELETSIEGRFTSIDGDMTEIRSNYDRLDTRITILEEKFLKNMGETTRDGKPRKRSSRLRKTKQEHAENTSQKDFDPFTFQDLGEKTQKKKEEASSNRNTLFSGVPIHLLKGFLKGGIRGAVGGALENGAFGVGGMLLGRYGGSMLRASPGLGAAGLLAYQLYQSMSQTPDAERGKKLEDGTHDQGFLENLWKNLDGRNTRDKLEYYKKLRDAKPPQTRAPWLDDSVVNPKRMMGMDKSQQNFEQQQKKLADEILKQKDLGLGPKVDPEALKMDGNIGPFFMFDQGKQSTNLEDMREHSFVTRKIVENDFVKHYQAQQREEMKKNFMLFGKMPGGFEFMDGHMGRLGMPSAVAATGAMPLSGFGGTSGGTRFTSPQGFGAPSPHGSGVPMVDPPTQQKSHWQKPGGTNIGQSQVGVDVGPMTVDRRGNVKPEQYYQAALQKLEGSKLIGFVPKDGERFGIKTGSKEEWARFMTQLTRQESNFNVMTVGDGGNSIGLSQMKAGEYGIKNPHDPHQAQSGMIKQFEKYILASQHITGRGSGPGTYGGWRGAAAYFGPLRREHEYFKHDRWMAGLRPTLDNIGSGLPQLSLPSAEALASAKPKETVSTPMDNSTPDAQGLSPTSSPKLGLSPRHQVTMDSAPLQTPINASVPEPISRPNAIDRPTPIERPRSETFSYSTAKIPEQFGMRQNVTFGSDFRNQPRTTERRRGEGGHGGEFNYSLSQAGMQEFGVPGTTKMQTLKTASGKSYSVHPAVAKQMESFTSALEKGGYKIGSIGGYANRSKAGGGGRSTHATGTTIDINPGANPFMPASARPKTDMPEHVEQLAHLHRLSWGARFGDAMHFETMRPDVWHSKLEQLVKANVISKDEMTSIIKNNGPSQEIISRLTGGKQAASTSTSIVSTNLSSLYDASNDISKRSILGPTSGSEETWKSNLYKASLPVAESPSLENISPSNSPVPIDSQSVPEGAQLSDAASAGFSEADTKPVSGLDTIAGTSAPTPVDVPSASPEKPVIAEASAAPASVEQTDFSTARTEDPTEGGSRSGSEATDYSVPQGGGRYNPETEESKPGSSGYGSKGRCFV